jgi:2-polyprenyl-3-methyl-5-hydroxy-6-metoxy-1,4-benzoquinol methylase
VNDHDGYRYPREFEPNTSHANAVALLDKAEAPPGVVLDIGCGNAPAAEPLAERGFEYVALDLDKASLDHVAERGFETHRVDLGVRPATLSKKLTEIVAGRDLVAIFALDILEHVVDPRSVVTTLGSMASEHPGCSLLISIPNVTHRDVATRLLLADWDMTTVGLLDDTHVRFFSPAGLNRLFAGTGWHEVDALDTTAEYTEQYTLVRSPALQPGAPLGDFLRRVRGQAAPHATTYQYVRRLVLEDGDPIAPAELADEPQPLLSIIVVGASDRLSSDLEAQTDREFEILSAGETWDLDEVNRALEQATGHYTCVLDGTDRVGPEFVASIRRGASDPDDPIAVDCVVRVDAIVVSPDDSIESDDFEDLVDGRVPIEPDGFDLLRSDLLGRTVLSAYAVPTSVIRTLGLRFDPTIGPAASSVFVARAVEMCSLRGVGDAQVVVDSTRVRDADEDLDAVREGLGSGAFLLPPGGVARLGVQRRTLVRSIEAERAMREELDELRPRAISAEDERDRLDAELTAVLNTKLWRYGSKVRSLVVRAKRLMESKLKSGRR